jgi:hypothetical protein
MMARFRLAGDGVYDSKWLQTRMDALEIGDSELYRRMQDRGYRGGSRTSVFTWRTGKSQIAPDAFPLLCLALGYSTEDMARMTIDYVSDAMPTLRPFLAMPTMPELGEFEKDMLKIGLADRKARLMAELMELEKLESA